MENASYPVSKRTFHYLFWGLLCTQLDLRAEGFDVLLPDWAGYLLIAAGLRELHVHPAFRAARLLAFLLAGLSLFTFYETPAATDLFKGYDTFPFLLMILDLIMVWQTIGGIMELAKNQSNAKLADTAQLRRLLYVAMVASPMFLSALTPAQQEFVQDYFYAYLFVALGVKLLLLTLMLRAGKELPEPVPPTMQLENG